MTSEPSTTLAAASEEGFTNWSPTLILATPSWPAWLSSAYPIVPSPACTALITPEVPLAASPPWVGHSPTAPAVHESGAALDRYSVKFFVVPDLSPRWTGVIVVPGSCASGLSAAIAGSFHVVMAPEKIFPRVSADRFRSVTPGRL